jgi:hypothetical protein
MSTSEDDARQRKARTLAEFCRSRGLGAENIAVSAKPVRDELCRLAGVKAASEQTWDLVIGMLTPVVHETSVTDGGLSNYTVTCTCGREWGVATASRAFAEQSAAEHVKANQPFTGHPFEGLG